MRIGSTPNVYNSYKLNDVSQTQQTGKTVGKKDILVVSQEARDFQTAMRAVSQAPDIRQDKVNQIKAQIDAGTYNVSSMSVAEKMIR